MVKNCPVEKAEELQTTYEKVYYPKHLASLESLRWLE